MIKGAQKRMIVVKTADSPLFEEAYFVMRRESAGGGSDLATEATRILENCGGKKGREKRRCPRWLGSLLTFLGGGVAGGSAVGLLWLLL